MKDVIIKIIIIIIIIIIITMIKKKVKYKQAKKFRINFLKVSS